jgi:hypothetical protein
MFGIDKCKVGFMNKPLESNSSIIREVPVLTLKTHYLHLHGRRVMPLFYLED